MTMVVYEGLRQFVKGCDDLYEATMPAMILSASKNLVPILNINCHCSFMYVDALHTVKRVCPS